MTAADIVELGWGTLALALWHNGAWRRGWDARAPKAPPVPPGPFEPDLNMADLHFGREMRQLLQNMAMRARMAGPGFVIVHDVPINCQGLQYDCRLALNSSRLAPTVEGPRRGN